MPLVLPVAPGKYDQKNEQNTRTAIVAEDGNNLKKNTDFGYFTASFGPIFVSPNGTRFRQTVDNAGAAVMVIV